MKTTIRARAVQRLLVLFALVTSSLGLFATAAFAHHPEVTATAECDGTVTVQAQSWDLTRDRGINEAIHVYWRTGDGPVGDESTWTRLEDAGGNPLVFQFVDTANPATDRKFTTDFVVPDTSAGTVDVLIVAQVWWGANQDVAAPRHFNPNSNFHADQYVLDVPFGSNCEVTDPAASVTVNCEVAQAFLDNSDSNVAVTFDVTLNGSTTQHVVAAGDTATVPLTIGEDEAYNVSVSVDGDELATASGVRDCITVNPAASITVNCEVAQAFLDNSGSNVAVTFDVTVNGSTTQHVVAAGDDTTVPLSLAEDAAYSVSVSVDGDQLASASGFRNCGDEPSATISVDCRAGAVAHLDNSTSASDVEFTITGGTDGDIVVTVPAGQTDDVAIPVAEDAAYDLAVEVDTQEIATADGTFDCITVDVDAAITINCDVAQVYLDNSGSNVAVTFDVTVNGVTTGHEVAAGDDATIPLSFDEDEAYSVSVAVDGDQLAAATGTYDCITVAPEGAITINCEVAEAFLDNTGSNVAVTFDVTVDGDTSQHEVAAGETATVPLTLAEDAAYDVSVAVDGDVIDQAQGVFNCGDEPAAAITVDCEGAVAHLDNSTSANDVTFTITGGADGPIEQLVAAGGTADVAIPMVEDAAYDLGVEVGGDEIASADGFFNCGDEPSAAITVECGVGATVALDNSTSANDVTFTVTGGADGPVEVVVAAGATDEVTVPLLEDEAYTVSVSANGQELDSVSGTYDCVDASSTITESCTEGGLIFDLDNSESQVDADFTVIVNGDEQVVTVPAGETDLVFVELDEDEAFEADVLVDGEVIASLDGVHNCVDVSGTALGLDCDEGVLVTLDNGSSQLPTTFTIIVDGVETDHTVPAGEISEVTVPVGEDEAYDVTVTVDGETIASVTGTLDCASPSSTIEVECTEDGTSIEVTLDNSESEVPVDYTVDINGDEQNVTVPAGDIVVVNDEIPGTEDWDISVSVGDEILASHSGEACIEILPEVLEQPDPEQPDSEPELAVTGTNTVAATFGALFLIGLGVLAVRRSDQEVVLAA